MALKIFNQTTQPLELTGGATLPVNGSVTVRELESRERGYAAAGHIFVREIPAKTAPAKAPKAASLPAAVAAVPESGNAAGK
jgi:hypothetical protein